MDEKLVEKIEAILNIKELVSKKRNSLEKPGILC